MTKKDKAVLTTTVYAIHGVVDTLNEMAEKEARKFKYITDSKAAMELRRLSDLVAAAALEIKNSIETLPIDE